MSAGDSLDPVNAGFISDLDPGYVQSPFVSGGLTDVGYNGGLADSVYTYTGSSTDQDVVPGSSTLALSTENGENQDTAVSDFIDSYDPASAQALSGVSDPPFASAAASTPTPNATAPGNPFQFAMNALSKLGSSFGTLFGNHTTYHEPGYVPQNGPDGSVTVPHTAITGQQLALILIIGGVIIVLLLHDVSLEVE